MLSMNPPAERPVFGPRAGDRHPSTAGAAPAIRISTPAAGDAEMCPNRCARWALGQGLRAGDAVALLTRDPIRAAPLRRGLDRVGIRVVSLDADLRDAALAAKLAASDAALVIADTVLADAYAGVMGRLARYPAVWWNGCGADLARLDLALAEEDGSALGSDEVGI